MKERAVLAAYVAGWAIVKALPERAARWLFARGAELAWRRQGKGVRRLRANLVRVVGEADADRVARAGLHSYARYWLEVFRLPVLGRARIVRGFHLEHEDRLRKAVADGQGVICALPHQGNWDVAGAWAQLTGMPLTTVAERLKPEGLFDRFVAFRESLGMEVVPLTGGEANPFDLLVERLRAGALLCLLADRDLTDRGVEVELFGARTRFPAGPAALALRTGATLLPVSLWFEGDGWSGRVHDPVPVPEQAGDRIQLMTQALARAFEAGIRERPEDWHMLQRLWLVP